MRKMVMVLALAIAGTTLAADTATTQPTVAPQVASQGNVTKKGTEAQPVEAQSTAAAATEESKMFSFDAVVDTKTGYYFRAYKIMNDLVVQPDMTLTLNNIPVGPLKVSPYIDWWNNLSSDQGSSTAIWGHWTETDINPGVIIAYGKWSLNLNYITNFLPSGLNAHNTARGADGQYQELDTTLSYDDSTDAKGQLGPFTYSKGQFTPISLQPHILYSREFEDLADHDLNTYLEFGITPELDWGTKLSFTFPTLLGCSLDSYYTDSNGHNDFFGYLGTGVHAKYQLNDHWDIHGGVDYVYALSSSIVEFNGGDNRNIFVGFVGVGLSY